MTRHRDLLGYAHMYAGNHADAEDLVQDALIETFGRGRAFPNAIAAESYVRRVIASRYIDAYRRRGAERRALVRIRTGEIDPSAGPDLRVEHASDVAGALAQLAPRERACVMMRYLEHLSVRETADALGLSEGAVKRYVSDAITKLNGLLGTHADAESAEWTTVQVRG